MKIARLAVAALLASAGLPAFAGPAAAHTALKSSSPAEGASLAAAPQKVELTFEEPVTLQPDPIAVTGPDGAKWTVSPPSVTDATITAAVVPSGPAGAYTVTYKVVSADGDKASGAVHFTLTAPASPPPTTTAGSPAPSVAAAATTTSPAPVTPDDIGNSIPAWVWILVAVVVVPAAVVVALRLRRPRP